MLHTILVYALVEIEVGGPSGVMLLGIGIVDIDFGIAMLEAQCGDGIGLRRGGCGEKPVGGRHGRLVDGRGCEFGLYVGLACAVVKRC